jgi:tight adherence protein C
MIRLVAAAILAGFTGIALLLADTAWAKRTSLAQRLRPHAPGRRGYAMTTESFAETVKGSLTPLASDIGGRVAKALGVQEELSLRLTRIHSTDDTATFRVREFGRVVASVGLAALVVIATLPGPGVSLLLLIAGPALAFLLTEQQLSTASERWQRRVRLELPVITEQLGILLGAGFSVPGALNRIASRSDGACSQDLRRVCARMRQGVSTSEALREWAEIAKVGSVDRLVAVLSLADDASDLSRIIGTEARASRQEIHRDLLATVERRGQQVWIPVTVAALIPGVILIAIPFLFAITRFADV